MMFKIKLEYKLFPNDYQSIPMFYSQAFFDCYVGKIQLDEEDIYETSAYVYEISEEQDDILHNIPVYYMQGKSKG